MYDEVNFSSHEKKIVSLILKIRCRPFQHLLQDHIFVTQNIHTFYICIGFIYWNHFSIVLVQLKNTILAKLTFLIFLYSSDLWANWVYIFASNKGVLKASETKKRHYILFLDYCRKCKEKMYRLLSKKIMLMWHDEIRCVQTFKLIHKMITSKRKKRKNFNFS